MTKTIFVSDHAIVRYLERVMGVDIEELKKDMIPEGTRTVIKRMGGEGAFPVKDGLLAVVRKYVVVTISARGARKQNTRKKK